MMVEGKASDSAAGYLDVLLLCAAPVDVRPALNLAVEVANFEEVVRRSPIPIRLRRVFPPTFEQLQRELSPVALRQRAPRVFHFLGHGDLRLDEGLALGERPGRGWHADARLPARSRLLLRP
jgi:hypothetical protein